MTRDPLYETLEEVLPVDDLELTTLGSKSARAPLEGLEFICAELLKEEGITAVTLGRQVRPAPGRGGGTCAPGPRSNLVGAACSQAEERRVVSQDLELWMTNQKVEDGYRLVARAGKRVQEVRVSARIDKEEMKRAIQRVLKRLP